jgi:ABC-type transport system involved in multi-copper enzyme maturation permease subunit
LTVESLDTITPQSPHVLRAWCYLVWLCFQRQARARQMIWIALGLLAVTAVLVTLATLDQRWSMSYWRWGWVSSPGFSVDSDAKGGPGTTSARAPGPGNVHVVVQTYGQAAEGLQKLAASLPGPAPAVALEHALGSVAQVMVHDAGFYLFSRWVVFSWFVSFLLPIWSLSFATDALGSEREGRSLIWLLTRPLPRASIYLAKFVALLPLGLALNFGGFGLLCALGGPSGHQAFRLYWPAVLGSTLAFCSLFHLLGAIFRRAAVVALVYSFFLETLLGNMPGYMKRISIGFYTRCLMFDAAQEYGIQVEKPSIYVPVSGTVAWAVLLAVTVVLLLVGMAAFARTEYQDLS